MNPRKQSIKTIGARGTTRFSRREIRKNWHWASRRSIRLTDVFHGRDLNLAIQPMSPISVHAKRMYSKIRVAWLGGAVDVAKS
jgi:hypothetical protein